MVHLSSSDKNSVVFVCSVCLCECVWLNDRESDGGCTRSREVLAIEAEEKLPVKLLMYSVGFRLSMNHAT